MPFDADPPGTVRKAHSLSELIQAAKACHRQGELYGRKSHEQMTEFGRLLVEAKKLAPARKWLEVLKEHWSELNPRTAQRWMTAAGDTGEASEYDMMSHNSDDAPPSAGASSDPTESDDQTSDAAAAESPDAERSDDGTPDDEPGADDMPATMADVGWLPPAHYADLADSAVKDLIRARNKVSAILEGPCGDRTRDHFRAVPPHWHNTGESVHEKTVHGVRVMGRIHEPDELGTLVRQLASLAARLRRPTDDAA